MYHERHKGLIDRVELILNTRGVATSVFEPPPAVLFYSEAHAHLLLRAGDHAPFDRLV